MAIFKEGHAWDVITRGDVVEATVMLEEGATIRCMGWTSMLGPLDDGDRVVVNTTGINLGLGTGGEGFILWNTDGPGPEGGPPGHIVKLRYTPWQKAVLATEAPESPSHDVLAEADGLNRTPVVTCGLHSQVAAISAGIKAAAPEARVGYLMTDGGALPIDWSRLVTSLRDAALVDLTATCGHAFGGDLETVNVFSGMVALKLTGRADVIVAGMGPGVVGTGTKLGTTALEQGQLLDAAGALGGRPIAALRISFSDVRTRHQGVSHHALTSLRLAAQRRATVVAPELPEEQAATVEEQLRTSGVYDRHDVVVVSGEPGLELMRAKGVTPSSMGRDFDECHELFAAASAAGKLAGEWLG